MMSLIQKSNYLVFSFLFLISISFLKGQEEADFENPVLILQQDQKLISLIIKNDFSKLYYNSGAYGVYFEDVLADGVKLTPYVINLEDVDMSVRKNAKDDFLSYVFSLESLVSSRNSPDK